MNYLERLTQSANETGSIVCMGLDPNLDAIPTDIKGESFRIRMLNFFEKLFNEMNQQKVYPGAFKPNHGFFEKLDNPHYGFYEGSKTLSELMIMTKTMFPKNIPFILDNKRGDIGKSSENYAIVGFSNWQADAVTVHPYMGFDSIEPFRTRTLYNHGVYILNRTSNSGAKDFQNLMVQNGDSLTPLYNMVANKIIEWSKDYPGLGAVVGATSIKEFEELAILYAPHNTPLLIPGVGKQGGSASEVSEILRNTGYKMELARINSSSGLTHPWETAEKAPADWHKICVAELNKLNEQINYKKAA